VAEPLGFSVVLGASAAQRLLVREYAEVYA
jgi:hypothetical protein